MKRYQQWITACVALSIVGVLAGCATGPNISNESSHVLSKPTLGGIALDDSATQVRALFHGPTRASHVFQHPYIEWDYKDGLTVIFHHKDNPSKQVGGVWKIDVVGDARLKTNTNLDVGASKNAILKAYKDAKMKTMQEGNYQTIVVTGSTYLLSFVLKHNKVDEIMLQEI